ncbi:MAG: haloacid dehalogenase-like hydrolase [Lachnospiraceae bacterium]|nr:haloacid dehalogenase-like hydrolase [Lachnospiraceae bacterium]
MIKQTKKLLSLIIVLITALTVLFSCVGKSNENYFSHWNDDSKVVSELKTFVEKATDKNNKDFIPVDDRIAVFDMDGTIFCETDPTYNEYLMIFDTILNTYDKSNEEDVKLVNEINEVLRTGYVSDELELKLSEIEYRYYQNMTIEEYTSYTKTYLDKNTNGYKNLKVKDALYKPMLQVIKYLQANDFTVYVVSGSERNFVRAVVCDGAGIKPNNVIGMDFTLKSTKQGNDKNSVHQFKRDEDVVIAGPSIDVNIKTHKVLSIVEEIGQIPVLAFGNSTGDFSMMEYVLKNNKYNSKGFMVLCDDNVRENGNLEKASMIKSVSDENGYGTISMKNDWKTIYGYDVEKLR